MNYAINDDGVFHYDRELNELQFSTSKLNIELLSDDELVAWISDCIAHEYLHKVINDIICLNYNNEIGYIVSALFESIEHHFRNYLELDLRITDSRKGVWNWKDAIDKMGMECVYGHYLIDEGHYLSFRSRLIGEE